MSIVLSAVKCFVFALNFFSLILGICIVCLNTFGLEYAIPNTDEHTYCIVGIILGSFVCMATLFGCYGVVCESLGVSVIYSFFMLMLLAAQLLQMQTYKHQNFFTNALDLLEDAWEEVDVDPKTMHSVEVNCGVFLYSCVLSILLFRRHRATYRTANAEDDYEAQQPGPHFHQVNSRSHLLSN